MQPRGVGSEVGMYQIRKELLIVLSMVLLEALCGLRFHSRNHIQLGSVEVCNFHTTLTRLPWHPTPVEFAWELYRSPFALKIF